MTSARTLLFCVLFGSALVLPASDSLAQQASPQSQPEAEAPPPSQDSAKPSGQESKPEPQPQPSPHGSPEPPAGSKPAQEPPQQSPPQAEPAQTVVPPAPGTPNEPQSKPGDDKTDRSTPAQPPASPAAPEPHGTAPPPASTDKGPPPSESPTPAKARRKKKASPSRKVVRDGGTSDVAVELSPGMSQQQASRQRQDAAQLMASTDENLKKIAARQLKPNEQEAVNQIHNYMEQAKAALKAGDLERSHNLALKAHLLSDALLPR